MPPELVIEAKDLGYSYAPGRFAIRHLDLALQRGEVLGLLGRNGAGKTTTVRVLTTLLPPTEGTATVLGQDVRTAGPTLRGQVGVVLQTEAFDFVSVERNLTLYAFMWGVPREAAKSRAEEMIELFELEKFRHRKPWSLSGGERRRLQVARELMHDMQVLFLDEPTAGLDAIARRRILGYIRKRAREGLSVVFTTHIMHEADLLCDRIAILHEGRLFATESPREFKRRFGGARMVTIEFDQPLHSKRAALERLLAEDGVEAKETAWDEQGVSFTSKRPEAEVARVSAWATQAGVDISRIDVREATLEEAFLGAIGFPSAFADEISEGE